jgi:hypothetical protein
MDSKGIPLEETLSYDGDWLLSLSKAKAGESDELKYVYWSRLVCDPDSSC